MGKRARDTRRTAERARAQEVAPASAAAQHQQRPPASRSTVPRVPRGNARWDALSALATTVEQIESLEARRDRQVLDARSKGASWVDCGMALGVSAQAVQQRFSKPSHTAGGGSS